MKWISKVAKILYLHADTRIAAKYINTGCTPNEETTLKPHAAKGLGNFLICKTLNSSILDAISD
jgi:hypothetical protein